MRRAAGTAAVTPGGHTGHILWANSEKATFSFIPSSRELADANFQ